MFQLLNRFIDAQIPAALRLNADEERKARLLLTFAVYAVIFACLYAPHTAFILKNPVGAVAICIAGVQAALTIVFVRRAASVRNAASMRLAAQNFTFLFVWLMGFLSWITGGVYAPALLWMPCGILVAFLFLGRKGGIVWTVVTAMNVLVMGILQMQDVVLPVLYDEQQRIQSFISGGLGAFALIAVFATLY